MGTLRSGDVSRRLLEIKGQLEEQRERRAQLQGELAAVLRSLKQDFGVDSIEAAEDRLESDRQALQRLEAELTEQIEVLEEVMDDATDG